MHVPNNHDHIHNMVEYNSLYYALHVISSDSQYRIKTLEVTSTYQYSFSYFSTFSIMNECFSKKVEMIDIQVYLYHLILFPVGADASFYNLVTMVLIK
jgi:hypothetical protein